jgi:methionyl-tRNA formyltransferase
LARILQHEVDHINGTLFTDRVKEQYFTKFPDLKKTKLLFCGSGEFGARVLESLYLIGFDFEIITETAKPAGRKRELKPTPVAEIAKRYGIKYIEVEKSTLNSKFSGFKPFDLLLCADFGQKIPAEILTKPKIAAINIHPSLLPKYQGPTPIQTAILNGEKETGVTIIKMSPEIDKGPILIQGTTEIFDDEDTPALRDRLAVAGVKLLLKLLPELSNRNTDGREQNNILATKTRKFTKEDALIDWLKTPQEIDRKILAFYPWPGTYTLIDNKRLIVHAAHLENDLLVLDVVQLEGKSPVYWQDFISNYKGKKPDWFKKIKI